MSDLREQQLTQSPDPGTRTPDMVNAVQARLEARAGEEFDSGHPRYVEWLVDNHDMSEFAPMIANLANCTLDSGHAGFKCIWQLRDDYIRFRIGRASREEREEIGRAGEGDDDAL